MIIDAQALDFLIDVAREAGALTLRIRQEANLAIHTKDDQSPVTEADHGSQAIILKGLGRLFPDIPVIAEELADSTAVHEHRTYWLVDPLDGTRDYIKGSKDYSINLGLIVDNQPAFGLIYAPARDEIVTQEGSHIIRVVGNAREEIRHASLSPERAARPRLTISIRDARKLPLDQWVRSGHIESYLVHASAYKFTKLATGQADIFLRLSPTYEWDTAAGDAMLRQIGGQIVTPDCQPIAYKKEGLKNGAFIAHVQGVTDDCVANFWRLLDLFR